MCEANVYLLNKDTNQCELLLEAVDKLVPQANGIYLENIFGERRLVNAYISSMELVQHKIILAQV